MSGVQIPVEAKLSAGDIDKVVDQLKEHINKLGASIAGANKVKFNPIDKATIEDMKRVQAQFESLTRISGDFRKRMKETGQGGAGFFDIDWARMYVDPAVRARQMKKAFNYVAAGTGASVATPAPAPAPGGGGASSAIANSRGQTAATSWRAHGRNIIGSGLNAAGPVGSVANSALSAGMSGGVMAGVAGLAGGLLALGVGKAISGIASKVGDAQNENIGYDTLKRQLGDVGASFEVLKDSLRAASSEIGVTFNEGQKLGSEFARIAGLTAKQSDQLADEVRIGGELGRSMGLDPSRSVGFMAQMREFGVTQNVSDSGKLAATIAEAIARSGSFAKADELLQAVAGFAAQQTRLGLTAANTTGYMGALAGLVGSHTPGLDVGGAADLLGRANGALTGAASGGNVAFQNFLYMALGRRNGLDPIQTQMLEEQGLFGSTQSTFGPGSTAARYGIKVGGLSNRTNIESVMDQMRRLYGGGQTGHELMASAISRNFNLSLGQSMALADMQPADLGGVTRRMSRLGIDLSKVNGTALSSMAQIEGNGSLTEAQKDQQERSAAANGQEKTTGSEVRDSIVGLQNVMQALADKTVPLLTDSRDALILMAGGGKRGAAGIHEAVINAQRTDVNAQADARIAKARAQYQLTSINGGMGSQTAGDMKAVSDAYANLQSETEAANKDRATGLANIDAGDAPAKPSPGTTNASTLPTSSQSSGGAITKSADMRNDPWLIQQLAETDRMDGLTPGTSYAQIMRESSFNPNATSKAGAMGLAQVMPKTLASLEKRFGRKINPFDKGDSVLIQRELMRENMSRYHGNELAALSAYNAGTDQSRWGNPETAAYGPSIMGSAGMYALGLPSGGSVASQKHEVNVTVDGDFTLSHPNGAAAAAPVNVSTRVGAPQASGGSY